ncbi:hypothetical protein [Halarchaeum salinum]|uniref:hypothetical protein n=1 Tax=Halarchaeum salinum TaxID=489912 RepID=UPI001B86FF54
MAPQWATQSLDSTPLGVGTAVGVECDALDGIKGGEAVLDLIDEIGVVMRISTSLY